MWPTKYSVHKSNLPVFEVQIENRRNFPVKIQPLTIEERIMNSKKFPIKYSGVISPCCEESRAEILCPKIEKVISEC